MRSNLLTAAIAMVLFGSMAGCANDTAGYDTRELTASNRTAIVRNGVHDGNADAGWNRREFGYGDGNMQTAPKDRTNVADDRTLGQDIRNAGDRAMNGVEDTTRDVANGVRNAARDTRNAVEDAVR